MAEAPYINYRVVQTLGDGYDDGSIPAERQTFAVVIAFPDHPGWWRVVGEFRSQSRAERYAHVENECRDDRDDGDGDTVATEPENAPAEPEGRISPENFDPQQYHLVADAAEFEAGRLTEQLRLAREEIAAGKSINDRLLTRIRSLEATGLAGELAEDMVERAELAERERDEARANWDQADRRLKQSDDRADAAEAALKKAEAEATEEAGLRIKEAEEHAAEMKRLRGRLVGEADSQVDKLRAQVNRQEDVIAAQTRRAEAAERDLHLAREELSRALVGRAKAAAPEDPVLTPVADALPLQAELGHRAASVLAALEALWDEGVYEVHTKHLTARGIPQGSLTVAFEILGRHGYATIEPGIPGEPRVRRLICRADGTAPMRAPAIEQIEQAEGQEAPAPEPAAPTPPPAASSPPAGCANCGAPMPEHRKGRFCSADCSQEAAREEERTRLATSTPVDDGIQVIPMRHAEDYGPAVPFKAGPLPPAPIAPAPGFNNPFAEKLAALGRK